MSPLTLCHRSPKVHVTFVPVAAQITRTITTMKCEELMAILNEYVDGTVDPAVCTEFEKHLADCDPCQVVVDNIRKTITLYKGGQPVDVPEACRERLHEALRKRWKETHSAS